MCEDTEYVCKSVPVHSEQEYINRNTRQEHTDSCKHWSQIYTHFRNKPQTQEQNTIKPFTDFAWSRLNTESSLNIYFDTLKLHRCPVELPVYTGSPCDTGAQGARGPPGLLERNHRPLPRTTAIPLSFLPCLWPMWHAASHEVGVSGD